MKQEMLRTSVERLAVGQVLGSGWHLEALWKKSVAHHHPRVDSGKSRVFLMENLLARSSR